MWPPGAGLESTVYLRQSRAKAGTPPGVQGRNITSGPCRPSLATGTWLSSSCDVSCLPPRFQVEITSFGWKTETVRNLGVCCLSRSEITATSVSGSSDIPFLPVGNLGPRPVLGSIPGLYHISFFALFFSLGQFFMLFLPVPSEIYFGRSIVWFRHRDPTLTLLRSLTMAHSGLRKHLFSWESMALDVVHRMGLRDPGT